MSKFLKNRSFLRSGPKFSTKISTVKLKEKVDRNLVIKEAEKVVGCSVHSLSIQKTLKNDNELVETVMDTYLNTSMTKTEGTVYSKYAQLLWGLVVLLVSKMTANSKKGSDHAILENQRIIAKSAEMLKNAILMHTNIVPVENDDDKTNHLGQNQLRLLLGDFLLSEISKQIASLRNSETVEVLASAIRDVCESQFFGLRDKEGRPIPSKPLPPSDMIVPYDEFHFKILNIQPFLGHMKAEWIVYNIARNGSSLGKCIRCALLLADHELRLQKFGYILGRNVALAWQASLDRDSLKEDKFDLISAPVMFHLEYDPGFYKEIQKGLFGGVDYSFIREVVMAGPGLEKTFQLENELRKESLKILEHFPDNEAKTALNHIIKFT